MRSLFLGLLFALSSPALADFVVEQQVVSVVNGLKRDLNLTWQIGKRGFRLDAGAAGRDRIYLFNGRVFYICGQLSTQAMAFLKAAKFSDAKALAALAKGACQEASTDFAIKFFLSPHMAILDETASSGLKINLVVSGLNIALDGKAGKQASTSCVGMERQLDIAETIADVKTRLVITECHAPSVNWRDGLGMELRKKLMMQPSGRKFHDQIHEDLKSRKGLLLSGSIKYGDRLQAGIKTTTVLSKDVNQAQFKSPRGFQMLDMKTEAMKASIPSGSKVAKRKKAPANALIQLLLLGGNPASALINAGVED